MTRTFPFPPFPNGWFQVAYSNELGAGEVHPLKYFGKDLVLFRTSAGVPRVLDAFCGHVGAHLGYGGRVEGETIRCPFHGWCWDGEGSCVSVPYAKKVPPAARMRPWPVCERNGMIMVWHHAEGKPQSWDVPEVPEYHSDDWTDYECRRWKIRTRNQEMAENAVDRAHFRYVHGTMDVPESKAEIDGHVLNVKSVAVMETPRGDVKGMIESVSWGFGFNVIRFTGIVETVNIASATAIDDETIDLRFGFMVRKLGDANATRGVGAALIADIEKQMSEDILIWENKIFLDRPGLCDGDGPIGIFRRWCRQFYSETPQAA